MYRLDLSKNTKLEQLDCDFCRTLEELVLPESLVSLDCEYNNLSELDLRHLINLERLNCPDNKLTALYLPQSAALKDVKCNDNLLTALDVSANTGLTSLTCYDNNLTELLNLGLIIFCLGHQFFTFGKNLFFLFYIHFPFPSF